MTELPSNELEAPLIVKVVGLMIGPAIEKLVEELGESPEAWRGAMMLHDLLRTCVAEVLAATPDGDEADSKMAVVMSGTACMTTLIDFAQHPTTRLMAKLLMERGQR